MKHIRNKAKCFAFYDNRITFYISHNIDDAAKAYGVEDNCVADAMLAQDIV